MGQGVHEGGVVMALKCKKAKAAYDKAYRVANKEARAAYDKAWGEAHKKQRAVYHKVYREAHKEKLKVYHKAYRVANKEQAAAYDKAWGKANREVKNALAAKRRALKLKQIPVHLRDCPHEKKRLVETYKLRNILTEATGVQHHVDHMWPLSDGGPHWSGNLQVIPAYDNLSKHTSVCEETKATIIKSLYTFESGRSI